MNKKAKSETPKVFLTDRAASDLLEIEAYSINKWGKNIATKYLGKFERVFKLLALNPDLLLPNPDLSDVLLFYRVERHLVTCVRTKAGIIVLTVTHANRDLVTLLHDLLPTLKIETAILIRKLEKSV